MPSTEDNAAVIQIFAQEAEQLLPAIEQAANRH